MTAPRTLPIHDSSGTQNPAAQDPTAAADASPAARAVEYRDEFPVSDNPNKSAGRTEDGYVNSAETAAAARSIRQRYNPDPRGGVDLDFHHPLEDLLAKRWMQRLLGWVSRRRSNGKTIIEELLESYRDPTAPFWQRLKYWPFHVFIDRMRGSVAPATFRKRISEHRATVRGFVVTARSVAEHGLTVPQRYSAPLFAVWNFTNRCNLRCQHCYQDSHAHELDDELTRDEKLDLIEQMANEYIAMIAFAGGEPTISPDLFPVLERCRHHGIHTSIATNGTTMTPELAARLAAAGVRYVEISLDSVDPDKHDTFRGVPGMWKRTVAGMRAVVAQEGLRLGIAMCVHQGNYNEVEDMLRFATEIGAGCLAHFNFIPVGRGTDMAASDITPKQRERLLQTLNRWMQSGQIGVLSTAPQLGRVCLTHAGLEGLQSCSHAGSGGGIKAKVVAKYLGGCGAGRTYVCVEPTGNITPCVYMPQRVFGNIRDRKFIDIYRENTYREVLSDRDRRTHHCEVCTFRNYCGGCRARADAYYGVVNAGDPGCIFNAKHWDDLTHAATETTTATETTPPCKP